MSFTHKLVTRPAAATLAVALLGAGTALVHAGQNMQTALPSVPSVDPGILSYPDADLAAEGYKVHHPDRVVSLPGGGLDYVYTIDGQVTEFPVTPIGFDPLTASPAQLATYRLPARPAGGAALTAWLRLMSNWRGVAPVTRLAEGRYAANSTPHQTTKDPIHGGYLDTPPVIVSGTSTNYDKITETGMAWTEPTVTDGCNSGKMSLAIWPGIDVGADVVQDGTLTIHETGFKPQDHQVWYEDYPLNPVVVDLPMTIPAGHGVDAVVHRDSSSSNATYIIKDLTTGVATVVSKPAQDWTGNEADWQIERPGSLDLGDFGGPMSMTYAYWVSAKSGSGFVGQSKNNSLVTADIMTGSTTLATVSGTYDSNSNPQSAFDLTWKACR